MLYPLKFKPLYKEYIWGGRNLAKYKRNLPETNIAESWEISCHPDGESIVDNGEYKGQSLNEVIARYKRGIIGAELPIEYIYKFPLLIKLIDANNKLSVQVHPDDQYAKNTGYSDYGKNEMWYILEAKPGARIVHHIKQGTTKEAFADAIEKGNVEACLNYVYVESGDTVNIPAGTVHALGEGIVLVEIQQNSNLTYRIYDYNRVDKNGNKRELHVDKALDVINFDSIKSICKISPMSVSINKDFIKTDLISNKYFSVEKYDVNGKVFENADGSKFFIYIVLDGECEILYKNGREKIVKGESVLVPAYTGYFSLNGKFQALKTYVPK